MDNINFLHCVLFPCSLVLSAAYFKKDDQYPHWVDTQFKKGGERKERKSGEKEGERKKKEGR